MNTNFYDLTSEEIDNYSGLRTGEIERILLRRARALKPQGNITNLGEVLHEGNQTWVGLDPQTLNTPYSELLRICELLSPEDDDLIIDLGAGYGRLGVVLDSKFPKARFLGYEFVPERVVEGNRNFQAQGCINALLVEQDLASDDFILPVAKFYFLYDYGKTEHIRKTLKQLEAIADQDHHFKVVARGKGSRSIIDHEHPWLMKTQVTHQDEKFSIYAF